MPPPITTTSASDAPGPAVLVAFTRSDATVASPAADPRRKRRAWKPSARRHVDLAARVADHVCESARRDHPRALVGEQDQRRLGDRELLDPLTGRRVLDPAEHSCLD